MKLHIPTNIIMENECVRNNADIFKNFGKKALILTYPVSKLNGSLSDVLSVLTDYEVCFDSPENPSVEQIQKLSDATKKNRCDYIIAIGGGSVIDSAKALALLATNDCAAKDLYTYNFSKTPLPIIAIPTTCGTGSEVTPVSVLTVGDTKLSFSKDSIIPKVALLDAKYIKDMPLHIKRQTAVDAFCHCAEGYLMLDDIVSDMFSKKAFELFAYCAKSLVLGEFTHDINEKLLYMGTLGGLAINITRTAAPHAMGYVLTVKKGLPHGLACGLLIGDYIKFSYPAKKEKTDAMLSLLQLKNIDELKNLINKILNYNETFTLEEIEYFTEVTYNAAIGKPNPKLLKKSDVFNIYKEALNIE